MPTGVYIRKKKRVLSEETKRKIGDAHRGKKIPEHVKKIHSERLKNCTGENAMRWNGGYKNKLPNCILCNKKLANIDGKKCKSCYLEFLKTQIGDKNREWKKDRSLLKKSEKKHLDTKYKYWMNNVKKRDRWKCRLLNSDCKGRLESHHIKPWKDHPELRYEINNGITLCHAHHPKKRAEEKRLEPLFLELVSVLSE